MGRILTELLSLENICKVISLWKIVERSNFLLFCKYLGTCYEIDTVLEIGDMDKT